MQVEIVDFYPQKGKEGKFDCGSLHIYIVDLNMDLKFCWASKKNNKWFFELPTRLVKKDGKNLKVPILSFIEKEKNSSLRKSFIKEANKFIKEWEKENV